MQCSVMYYNLVHFIVVRKGDKGSPCLSPWEGVKASEVEPFRRIDMTGELTIDWKPFYPSLIKSIGF